MVLLRRNCYINYQIPIAFQNRNDVYAQPLMYDFLYSLTSENHHKKLPVQFNLSKYFEQYYEFIMRGMIVEDAQNDEVIKWTYIHVHDANANDFCNALIQLQPSFSFFEKIPYGKKDHFFHKVPVECLHQFYANIPLDSFCKWLADFCELVPHEFFAEQKSTMLGTFLNKRDLKLFHERNCYYIEDAFDNIDQVDLHISRLNKTELFHLLNFSAEQFAKQQKNNYQK